MKFKLIVISLFLFSTAIAGIDNIKPQKNEPRKQAQVESVRNPKPVYDRRYEDWKRNESLNKASQAGNDRYIIRDGKKMW